ncbi:MAG: thiamine pyrophosphate-binding protein [Pseudonocardia sp.]|nr:thiamine pyrophosphate-binding protein [Pseudonocardia sp.]
MDQTRTVADDVLDVLREAGAGTVFGLPGVHNLAFFSTGPGSPLVLRHEQAATYAADGWARRTGRLGAAVVTTGPGATNALTGFGEAAAAGSPVVLVASEIPQRLRRAGRLRGVLHESRDQAALFAPLAKAVFTPRTPDEVARDVRVATTLALTAPRGPVYLDVPADVLPMPAAAPHTGAHSPAGPASSQVGAVDGPGATVRAQHPATAPEADLNRVADVLRGRSVVVWAGSGALDAAPQAEALAAHLGAPLVPSFHAHGLPGAIGVPPHEPELAELIGSAEVLLAVGGDLDGMNTRNWTMPRPPLLATVDAAEPTDPPEWTADATLTGPVPALLDELRDRVPSSAPWWPGDLTDRVRTRLREDPASAEAFALVECAEAAAARGAVLVCDMAVAGYWVGGYARAGEPRGLAYPVGWGTLGFGLPAAIGVAATGVPTLAVVGDGGLAMGLGELATLVQERLPVTVLVVDDAGYGMLRYDQDRAGHPHAGVDLHTPDLVALAGAFGMAATGVAAIGPDLATALTESVASGLPHLFRVSARLLPPRTTSPRWNEG